MPMMRRYAIRNLRSVLQWQESKGQLDFVRNKKRLSKRMKQRAFDAVGLLKGIGWLTPYRFQSETIESVTIDYHQLERFILENHYELVRRFNIKDSVVLMGPAQFYELTKQTMREPLVVPLSDFQCGFQNRLRGMFVVVLPWMDGTVLVPKEYLPIENKLVPSGIMVKEVTAPPNFAADFEDDE